MEKQIRKAAEDEHIPIKAVVFCTPKQYFEAVEKSGVKLPTYSYDFNPPEYIQDLRGLYGERPANKLANRRAEEMLESAEKFGSVTAMLGNAYPSERLGIAWENVLFNQDHDAIPGSHTDAVDDEMMSRYAGSIETGRDLLAKDLYLISRRVNTTGSGDYPFLVFNPLSFGRTEVVRYGPLFKEMLKNFRLVDMAGTPVPFRAVDVSNRGSGPLSMAVIEFEAKDIPAFGIPALPHRTHGRHGSRCYVGPGEEPDCQSVLLANHGSHHRIDYQPERFANRAGIPGYQEIFRKRISPGRRKGSRH